MSLKKPLIHYPLVVTYDIPHLLYFITSVETIFCLLLSWIFYLLWIFVGLLRYHWRHHSQKRVKHTALFLCSLRGALRVKPKTQYVNLVNYESSQHIVWNSQWKISKASFLSSLDLFFGEQTYKVIFCTKSGIYVRLGIFHPFSAIYSQGGEKPNYQYDDEDRLSWGMKWNDMMFLSEFSIILWNE